MVFRNTLYKPLQLFDAKNRNRARGVSHRVPYFYCGSYHDNHRDFVSSSSKVGIKNSISSLPKVIGGEVCSSGQIASHKAVYILFFLVFLKNKNFLFFFLNFMHFIFS
uniref:Uncharacterized protein n=1 Tax=Cacopsylla melanoneura TaxID=428564 RepID=A0A8D9AS13_9HEMI